MNSLSRARATPTRASLARGGASPRPVVTSVARNSVNDVARSRRRTTVEKADARANASASVATRRPHVRAANANTDGPSTTSSAATYDDPETVFLETNGAPASLVFNILMGFTIVYAPLTIAALGRAAWIKIRFTNKRLEVINTSPLFKGTQQVAYSQIKEVRSAPRAFDQWGDVVLFLKGGGTVELTGLPRHREIVEFVRARSEEARRAELERKLREAGEAAGAGAAAADGQE